MAKKTKQKPVEQSTYSDYQNLRRAIWWAEQHGYTMPPLESAVFTGSGAEPLRSSLRLWATGLILSKDFAMCLFGNEQVELVDAKPLYAIKLWATQVAYEFEGKIYSAEPGKKERVFLKAPEIQHAYDAALADAPVELEYPERVVQQLQDLAGMVPFRTHKIKEVDIVGGIPNWEYHLRQMTVSVNPFAYAAEYVERAMLNERRPDWVEKP